jgi:hypothetical protein
MARRLALSMEKRPMEAIAASEYKRVEESADDTKQGVTIGALKRST